MPTMVLASGILYKWSYDKNEYWIMIGRTDVPPYPSRLTFITIEFTPSLFNELIFTTLNVFWLFWQKFLDIIWILREFQRFSRWTKRYSSYLWYSPLKPQLRI
jgi:hypothetical protein